MFNFSTLLIALFQRQCFMNVQLASSFVLFGGKLSSVVISQSELD